MKKTTSIVSLALVGAGLLLVSCKPAAENATDDDHGHEHAADGSHMPAEGEDHGDHDDHDHGVEVALGSFDIGGITVEAAQAHGNVEAGKEGHLVIKLPYSDQGETVVRAWIGVEDRTLSSVGKGVFGASHGDYDIHMMAPDPLPEGSQWWLEIEKPDGTSATGSFPFN